MKAFYEKSIHKVGCDVSVRKYILCKNEAILQDCIMYFWKLRALRPYRLLLPEVLNVQNNFLIATYRHLHAVTLAEFLKENPKKSIVSKIFYELKMTDLQWRSIGFIHGDLHLKNILIELSSDDIKIHIIDPKLTHDRWRMHRRYSHPIHRYLHLPIHRLHYWNDRYGLKKMQSDLHNYYC